MIQNLRNNISLKIPFGATPLKKSRTDKNDDAL